MSRSGPEDYLQGVTLRVLAFRAIAVLAAGSAAASAIPGSAAVAGKTPGISLTSVPAVSLTAARPGTLTGIVINSRGQTVAGVCVTATAATEPEAGSRTALTSADGLFMIADLRAGRYRLRYRDCLTGAGQLGGSRAAALGPGPLTAPAAATGAYVTGGHVSMLGRITLRSAAADQAAPRPVRPAPRTLTPAQLRHRFAGRKLGGVAGRVLGPHGRPVRGLCFNINFRGGSEGGPVGADGRYHTGKSLPPGTYTVDFNTVCKPPFLAASANWAPEWYRDHLNSSAADPVVVKAGKITRDVSGVMRPGGVIAGTVTGRAGRGQRGVCIVVLNARGSFVQQLTTPRDGRYKVQGLDPGQYNVGFFPNCGYGKNGYLQQWWPGTAKATKRGLIRTGIGTVRNHVDARLVLGGTISGTVRFRNSHGQPIKGICVDAAPAGQPDGMDVFVSTNARGRYRIGGLAAGRYALDFSPGCNNNGNYLGQNYPHAVTVRDSQVKRGINAYLQPGAIITGRVTAKSDGAGLQGICVVPTNGFAVAETGPTGTYSVNQLSPGQTQVFFTNCASDGNFAPQVYPDQFDPAKAVSIKVRSGQVVKGINAAMATGATISGSITLTTGAEPSSVCVDAAPVQEDGNLGGALAVTQHGRYVIDGLPPGTYQVEYQSCGGTNIADAMFSSPGHVTQDQARADQINLPLGGGVSGVDATVQLGGSISGWIYGPAKHQGSFTCQIISDAKTGLIANNGFGVPLGDGYTIFGFAPGRYLVEFYPCGDPDLAPQWFDRATRPGLATPVLVRAGHITRKVNAHLIVGGSISGRVVSKLTGKPLAGVCVTATGVNQPAEGFGGTDQSGKYVVTGLNSGTYRLIFSSCGPVGVVPLRSGVVRATVGTTVSAPKVAVVPVKEGAISGRVSAAGSPPALVADACVDAISVDRGSPGGFDDRFGATGARGRYQVIDLVPGRYKIFLGVQFCTTDPGGLVPQWFGGTSQMSKATVVTVAADRTTRSIDVTLRRDGSISGTVTGPKPARKPLTGVCVQVVPVAAGGTPTLAESTGANGEYRTGPLLPGKYLVEFESGCGATGFRTQWWRGATSMKSAMPVTVQAGIGTKAVSATMTPVAG
jgi:hypothetical protein